MTTTTSTPEKQTINREALAHLREEGILLENESLALNVDKKVDAGLELTPVEAKVLWRGITQEHVQFVKQYLL